MMKKPRNFRKRNNLRQKKQRKLLHAVTAVSSANSLEDPLTPFPEFQKYVKNDIDAELFIKRSTDLDHHIIQWAFNLTKQNMEVKYNETSWGWSDKKKMEELSDKKAWYLIAKNSVGSNFFGFSHFRFDIDEGFEVLYCYELQLEASVHRKGLGKYMMHILEAVAFKNNMKKVVLTVLKNNPCSEFYRRIGYDLDESSPGPHNPASYSYAILSKSNHSLLHS